VIQGKNLSCVIILVIPIISFLPLTCL